MTLRIDCPTCGQQFDLDDNQADRSARCPGCDSVILATGLNHSEGIATLLQSEPGAATPRRSEPMAPAPRRSPRAAGNSAAMAGLILGIIALVLGVPALVISWVPMFCLVGLITAGIGLLAGTIGIAFAVMQKGEGLGVSIVGGTVNLLALLVALLMTFVSGALIANLDKTPGSGGGETTETSRPAAGPEAKDIPPADGQPEEAGARLPGWGQKVDPDNDCTFAVQGAGLDVTVPPTPHDLSVELARTNAPRVLQEVVGDFTLRVKVCGVLRPTAPGSVEGRLPYQAAGLLVWSNEDNYLRLERAGLNRNGKLSSYIAFELRVNGLQGPMHSLGMPEQDTYLRLERRGNQFRAFVSSDGQEWEPPQNINVTFPAKVRVGVAVVNAARQQLQVRFEEFQLKKP